MTDHATTGDKPLRILLIVNFPWDERLGASRVFIELANEWRAAGHVVEIFSFTEAFGRSRTAGVRFAAQQIRFTRKAANFVRANASRFDVIDAIVSALAASKRRLNFDGLLVARSVGMPALYEQFETAGRKRWPEVRRGTPAGRVLHRATRSWLRRASRRSLENADLINVPNADEARYLRESGVAGARVIIQPYGLTETYRQRCAELAQSAANRLQQKIVCFIGMWSVRKGARDWAAIIAGVRARVPDARFRFLGTMVGREIILRQLGVDISDHIELIAEFEPAELPRLLSDCAVGAFPSYVEGFGLAVLEQLAAGLPTIAYDVPGPRDIMGDPLRELLVPAGDTDAFAPRIARVLLSREADYAQLSQNAISTAARFSWRAIAAATLREYRARIKPAPAGAVLFVQPFGLASAGGGARILRALLEGATVPWHSVCTSPERPPRVPNETHLPTRPSWGKLEFTRMAFLPQLTARLFAGRFRHKFRELCIARHVSAIHAIPHWGTEFHVAQEVARELRIPFFLQVHDDFEYSSRGHVNDRDARAAMRAAWQAADARFVIGERLGQEYCRRYGAEPYDVVTDGAAAIAPAPRPRTRGNLRIYFMGLFHLDYEANVRALLSAMAAVRKRDPHIDLSITLRCGTLPGALHKLSPELLRVLPFGNETDVQRDLESADLLYLPLPFGQDSTPFVRFSLSTKMITYLASGLPVLYHGPADSALHEMVSQHQAALSCTSLGLDSLVELLSAIAADSAPRDQVTRNALHLAGARFRLEQQQQIFWNAITAQLAGNIAMRGNAQIAAA